MSKDAPLRVLVVGASIAGPASAYWLARAGAKVTVIERFPQLRTNGQNIDIRTVGVTVMRKMPGMEAAVRAKAVPMNGISFVDTNGRAFATIPTTGNPDQQSLVSEYEILRGDLSQILFDLTKDDENITYIFGEQVSSIEQHHPDSPSGPLTVTFANGLLPTQDFDLLVASDGAASRTRALGLGCSVRDHVHPVNTFAAYFSIPQDAAPVLAQINDTKIGQGYSAPGGRLLAVGPTTPGRTTGTGTGTKTALVTLLAIHPRADPTAMAPFREAHRQGDAALRRFVTSHFLHAGWVSDAVLAAMQTSPDFYASEVVQVKTPRLHRGRVVLVGDAGYAPGPTGTGTSLALAGGYVLAGEVARHKGDLEAALSGYGEVMAPVVEQLQKIPMGVPGVFAPQSRWGLWVRNVVLWAVCGTGLLGWVQRWSAGAFGEREEVGLPEYEWATEA